MFDGLKRNVAGAFFWDFLKTLATSKNAQTNIAGILAGAVIAIPGLDRSLLMTGDLTQIAHLASGLLVWGICYFATKPNKDGVTSLMGLVAGVLQAHTGQIQDITNGLVITLGGYLTNKPVQDVAVPPEKKA